MHTLHHQLTLPFGSSLVPNTQSFWLVDHNDVYQQFTCVDHTVLALAPYRLGLAVSASPRVSAYGFPRVLLRQLHTIGLPLDRMCRWALMDELNRPGF